MSREPEHEARAIHDELAWRLVAAGAAFGVLGDVLFHDTEIGINAVLWLGPLAAAGWLIHRRSPSRSGAVGALLAAGVFFAFCLGWRASPFLRVWSLAGIGAAVVTMTVRLRGPLLSARILDYARAAADLADSLVAAPVRLLGQMPPLGDGRRDHRGPALALGTFLAIPVVLVFGTLLAAADPAMDAFLRTLVTWDVGTVLTHSALLGGTAWLAAGALWRLAAARTVERMPGEPRRFLGLIEFGIPLGALAVLLAMFIGLQTRYLFGGDAFVRVTGRTYAEFARRGFFELVVLAALVIPVLLAARYLVDRTSRAALDSFRALAVTITLLVGLVMVSAIARMRLYVEMYGLTEDRFYAATFTGWLCVVLAWFVITEFRWLDRFATGAVAAGFLLLAALNVANPDAIIARINLDRATAGAELDARYLTRLSTDAVPVLAGRWTALGPDARCAIRSRVQRAAARQAGWRAWTWSTWRAARVVRDAAAPVGCDSG